MLEFLEVGFDEIGSREKKGTEMPVYLKTIYVTYLVTFNVPAYLRRMQFRVLLFLERLGNNTSLTEGKVDV